MNEISKQPSAVPDRDDEDDDDDRRCFGSGTEWQAEAIYAVSLDYIFREGAVIKAGRKPSGLICAVLSASRCAGRAFQDKSLTCKRINNSTILQILKH